MPGKHITEQQVRLYMTHRKRGESQPVASAKAGLSERTGRRIESGELAPGAQKPRHWRTRKDPFSEVWESEVVPMLEKQPALSATTLFEDLQERHPGVYPNARKRTFQRRVKAWKALRGPDKEVMFRQRQEAGRLGLSDFTEPKDVEVHINGEPLSHRLYHFRLPFSGWSHVKVVLGGESYTALAEGLQEAPWRLGGAPREHRADSLSAAYKNLNAEEKEDLTERHEGLCGHYGMHPTRNNRGASHENGAVESPHGHLKRRIKQALLLRGNNEFDSIEDYRRWLDELARRFNRRRGEALAIERAALQALPKRRTTDFTEQVVSVTTASTIEVKRVLYTVPARLVGEQLRLHIFDDRIDGYVGAAQAVTLPRVYPVSHERRARRIDYRHLIGQLVRKPQAFRYSQLRDDLLPNATYRRIWTEIDTRLEARAACKRMVGILALAARADCEQALGAHVLRRLDTDTAPTLLELERRFAPRTEEASSPDELLLHGGYQHPLALYDALLPVCAGEVH